MNRYAVMLLWCCVLAGAVRAQVTPSFVVPTELSAAGLRVSVPARSVEEPLPPLEKRLYRFQQGTRSWEEERFEAREIWLRSQLLGQWRDAHGNRLRILQPGYRFPSVSDTFVPRSEYDAQAARMRPLQSPTSEEVLGWIGDYLQETPGVVTAIGYPAHPLQAAALVATTSERQLIYALRVAGHMGSASRYYVVDITLNEKADVARTRHSFEERFLRALAVFTPQEPARPAASTGIAGTGGAAGAQTPELARSRADAHASVANLRNWRSVDVGAYVLLSDQRRGANQLIRDLERTLEPMRAAYAVVVLPLRPIQAVGIIRLFADEEEYVRYVGPEFAWSAGLWSEARGELIIRPVDAANYQQARERVLRTVYHEAFHQYLSLATSPLRVCVWFNEGHAVLFEHARIQNGNVMLDEHQQHADRATSVPLQHLFALTYDQFYGGTQEERQQRYATAWGLVYYLRRSAAADPQFAFAGLLDAYMKLLVETGDGPRATQQLLQRYPLAPLEADFRDFWQSQRRRRSVMRAPLR
jgi:hypothetical protein